MPIKKNKIDLNALKFNQSSIIVLVLLGFILNQIYLPAFVAIILIAGSINTRLGLFKLIYSNVFVPLEFVKPNIAEESSAPHNFAQLLGGTFLTFSSFFLLGGFETVGWILSWFVILLAVANLAFGFCAGCFVYYQLEKFGVPGFHANKTN